MNAFDFVLGLVSIWKASKNPPVVNTKLIATEEDIKKAAKAEPASKPRWSDDDELTVDVVDAERGIRGTKHEDIEDFLKLYGRHPHVYTCASRITRACASVKYQILEDGEEVKAKKAFSIVTRPNPYDTWYDFLQRTILVYVLSGNVFWEIVRDSKGKIVAIFNLMPHKMKIVTDKKKKIKYYVYTPKAGTDITLQPNEVVHFHNIDPTSEYWGMSAITALSNSLTLDFYAVGWNKSFFQQGAEPGVVLETERDLTDQSHRRLVENWLKRHMGMKKAHLPAILEGGLKLKQLSLKHNEMEYTKLRDVSKAEIYDGMGVPLDWHNASARRVFYYDVVIPLLENLAECINVYLLSPEGDVDKDKLEFKWVTESIDAIIEDDAIKSGIANSYISHGVMTINEFRKKKLGLPPVPWGDTYWAPVGLAPWDSGAHPMTPGTDPDVEESQRPGKRVTDDYQAGQRDPSQVPNVDRKNRLGKRQKPYELTYRICKDDWIDLEKIQPELPAEGDRKGKFLYDRWIEWQKSASGDEKYIQKKMKNYFSGFYGRLSRKLKYTYRVRKAEDDEKNDANDVLLNVDFGGEVDILQGVYEDLSKNILPKYGEIFMLSVDKPNKKFKLDDPKLVEWSEKWSASRVKNVMETTRELIKRSITESFNQGLDFDEAMKKLGEIFVGEGGIAEFRARRIARTELVTLSNQAQLAGARQTGIKKKTWICQRIPTSRNTLTGENHVNMHGVTVDIDKQFEVRSRTGIDLMDGPGDISASPENICFCLCLLTYPPQNPEFQDLFDEIVNKPPEK